MLVLQLNEIRKAYFLKAFGLPVEDMQIISFGKCNYNCPYCKRDGQFKDSDGNIINAYNVDITEVLKVVDVAIEKGRRIRLSGGDPCCFHKESLAIAKYVKSTYNKRISIAHNGSSPYMISELAPYLEYVAIDIKGSSPMDIAYRSRTNFDIYSYDKIIRIIKYCNDRNILVDCRTPVFSDTKYDDLRHIAMDICNYDNVFWTLRAYNSVEGCDFKSPDIAILRESVDKLHMDFPTLKIGARDKWNTCNFYIPNLL